MSTNIKKFKVGDEFRDMTVTLEVDTAKLDVERATLINEFWGDADRRLSSENGDVVRAVVRYFGLQAILIMLEYGGISFGAANRLGSAYWSEKVYELEGWGGADETPYGFCGIRVIGADVDAPDFNTVELEEA